MVLRDTNGDTVATASHAESAAAHAVASATHAISTAADTVAAASHAESTAARALATAPGTVATLHLDHHRAPRQRQRALLLGGHHDLLAGLRPF